MTSLSKLFNLQKKYNKKVYGDDEKSPEEVEIHTQELALCAHAEISSLISATKYKKHHRHQEYEGPDLRRILYESVDVTRYIMAILNLWDIDSKEFHEAFLKKDNYLNVKHEISKKTA